jgi:hypothetical protein
MVADQVQFCFPEPLDILDETRLFLPARECQYLYTEVSRLSRMNAHGDGLET